MTLLDRGYGWSATMRRTIEKYEMNVIVLTLSKNQTAQTQKSFDQMNSPHSKRMVFDGWEQFRDPVDRIMSIVAFEHFGHGSYDDFFELAYSTLPDDGAMLWHTITGLTKQQMIGNGFLLSLIYNSYITRFFWFIFTEISQATGCQLLK